MATIGARRSGGMNIVAVILVIVTNVATIGTVVVGSTHKHKMVVIRSVGRSMVIKTIMSVANMLIRHSTIMIIVGVVSRRMMDASVLLSKVGQIMAVVMMVSHSIHRKIVVNVNSKYVMNANFASKISGSVSVFSQ